MTIAREDGTTVRLLLLNQVIPKPVFGSAEGLIQILDGFDDPIAKLQIIIVF